jgi:hypothetical protein
MLQETPPEFKYWKQETLALVARDRWVYAKELEANIVLLQQQIKEKT